MKKAALYLSGKPVAEQIQTCNNVVAKMTGNLNFPTPNPSLKEIEADIADLQTKYDAALNGGTDLKESMYASQNTLLVAMAALVAYVTNICLGDPEMIYSAGMYPVKSRTKTLVLDVVLNLLVRSLNGKPGMLKLKWKPLKGAKAYNIQQYIEQPTSTGTTTPTIDESNSWKWVAAGTSSHASYTAIDLVSGMKYWYRVQAVGPKNITGGWSAPAGMVAPY
jgi:hypothetical protein